MVSKLRIPNAVGFTILIEAEMDKVDFSGAP